MTLITPVFESPLLTYVLLIEEDPKEIEFYSSLIRELVNCKIDTISQGRDSLDWVGRSKYHLAVISEDQSGLALLEQIKRISPATTVILISKTASVEEAVTAIRMGAEDYLPKPVKVENFQLAIKRGLDKKTVFGDDTGASKFIHLLNSCQLISASLEQKNIFETIHSYLKRELNAGYSAIYSLHESEAIRVDTVVGVENYDKTLDEVLEIAVKATNPLVPFSKAQEFYRFIDRAPLTPALFLFRFQCAGQSEYFCVCLAPERPQSMEMFESRLRLLKAQIEVTGKSIEQYLGVQKLVYLDDVTGLYNTRYLHYILEREISQAELTHGSFAVLFLDADHFKQINDKFGHLVGTKLLNELGSHLKKYVRDQDSVFRYGGDEFVAILSSCDLEMAKTVAERIRESVQNRDFLKNEGLNLHFTVSIGIALFPDHATTKKEIIDAADKAMYSAKKSSRNSVVVTKKKRTIHAKSS